MKTNVLEKLFIAKYPEYEVHGKPMYEYFELFESSYELSDLHIAELEYEIEELTKEKSQLENELFAYNLIDNLTIKLQDYRKKAYEGAKGE